MALKLEKLVGHLQQGDEDMAVLALRTFMRSEVLPGSQDPPLLGQMRESLLRLVESNEEDVRFFARQALDKVGQLLAASGVSVPEREGDEDLVDEGVDEIIEGESEAVTFRAPTMHGSSADALSGVKSRTALRALRALHALGTSNDEASVAKVLALFNAAADPWIKASCLSTLGRMGRSAGLRTIISALRHPHARVRANAVEAISGIAPRDRCISVYLDAAGDPDRRVRTNALRGLAEVDPGKVLDLLDPMARSSKISARASAVFVLGRMSGKRVLDLLEGLVEDEAEEIRLRCVTALERQKGLRSVTLLRRLVCDMDIDVAEKALAVYECKKEEEGVQDSQALDLDVVRNALHLGAPSSSERPLPPEAGDVEIRPSSSPAGLEALMALPDAGLQKPAQADSDPTSDSPELLRPEGTPKLPGIAVGGGPGRPRAKVVRGAPTEGEDSVQASDWPEDPEVADRLHAVYDEIDEVLVRIGRQVDEEEKANLFDGQGRFDKVLYTVRRYQRMVERRREAAKEQNFFENFVRRGVETSDPGMFRLESTLYEQYRLIGELAMDLAMEEELRFPQFNRAYKELSRLLDEAQSIKSGR